MHSGKPAANSGKRRFHSGRVVRCCRQKRSMANMDSENVRNTLMLYMTTRWPTSPAGVEQRRESGNAHQQDAVLGREPLGERRKAMGHPGVHGHVGQHAGTVR